MENLPPEIHRSISEYLEPEDIQSMLQVSHRIDFMDKNEFRIYRILDHIINILSNMLESHNPEYIHRMIKSLENISQRLDSYLQNNPIYNVSISPSIGPLSKIDDIPAMIQTIAEREMKALFSRHQYEDNEFVGLADPSSIIKAINLIDEVLFVMKEKMSMPFPKVY